jgi:hypothetical protein
MLEAYDGDEGKFEKLNSSLPEFRKSYEGWYSESLRVILQLIPDRLNDFKYHYETPKGRKSVDVTNYTIQDMLHGLSNKHGHFGLLNGMPRLQAQMNILESAKSRFQSSLFDMKQIMQADLFDSEIDAARELLRNKFTRAAGAIAGVVLERHLKQVAEDHGVKVKTTKPTLSVLNDALKDASVIDVPQWRFNQHLGDIRNSCDHAREPEPTKEQVQDLIDGTSKVMKTIA